MNKYVTELKVIVIIVSLFWRWQNITLVRYANNRKKKTQRHGIVVLLIQLLLDKLDQLVTDQTKNWRLYMHPRKLLSFHTYSM